MSEELALELRRAREALFDAWQEAHDGRESHEAQVIDGMLIQIDKMLDG